jgi:hypothetical protein
MRIENKGPEPEFVDFDAILDVFKQSTDETLANFNLILVFVLYMLINSIRDWICEKGP